MPLKKFRLPNGTLYVNTSDSTIEHIIDNGVPVEILPKKAYLAGEMREIPLEEYFACPELWDAKWDVHQAIQKKGTTAVAIDARGVTKFGDQIMLTLLPKAYKETWGPKAIVDVMVAELYKDIWKHNPHVHRVTTKLDKSQKYDKVMDATGLGMKFRRKKEQNCADAIVNGLGLSLINKTPVYVITEEERQWAEKEREYCIKHKGDQPIIGVSLYSAVKSRTYPHMLKIVEKLEKEKYRIVLLDRMDNKGNYVWTFRQMAAMVNECDLILTADSALLHLAGALKKRIVGIFAYTEGHIFTESYEKAVPIQAPCPYNKSPCWWEIECIPGSDHLAKTNKDFAHCLKELKPEEVVDVVKKQFTKPKNLLLVMLTYNALGMTKKAVDSIRTYHNYDFFVVDNKSTDGTQRWLEEQSIDFISAKTSVAAAQNIGIEKFLKGDYDYLIFLNNDIVLRYDCLDALVSCAERSEAYGVMGIPLPGLPWKMDSLKPQGNTWKEVVDIPAGSYSCTLFSRKCIKHVGIFNERYQPRYIEDNDYTLRIRALGGKFIQAQGALFWHYLGVVVRIVEKDKQGSHSVCWKNNIDIFKEMYGIHPHEAQDLRKLGLEWHRKDYVVLIKEFLKNHNRKAGIRIERRMGGYGDILFTTVVAKALKSLFKNKIKVNYFVPKEFKSLLEHNSNIDGVFEWRNRWEGDFRIDLTDLEFRVELQEMRKYGCIQSARTQIYLDILGLSKYLSKENSWLKPEYFVTGEEKEWAEEVWDKISRFGTRRKYRIVAVSKGSNKLKDWPLAQDLFAKLWVENYILLQIDEDGKAKWSFRKAAALVASADLVISPDSGISNLAGTLDVPVITIFSNRNGAVFSKMFSSMKVIQGHCPNKEEDFCDFFCPCFGGGPHRSKENKAVPECLKRLELKEVYNVVKRMLK